MSAGHAWLGGMGRAVAMSQQRDRIAAAAVGVCETPGLPVPCSLPHVVVRARLHGTQRQLASCCSGPWLLFFFCVCVDVSGCGCEWMCVCWEMSVDVEMRKVASTIARAGHPSPLPARGSKQASKQKNKTQKQKGLFSRRT